MSDRNETPHLILQQLGQKKCNGSVESATENITIEQIKAAEQTGKALPEINAMLASMVTLRPDHALYRAHRQELTDPWVGPGAARHTEMIKDCVHRLIDRFIERDEIDFIEAFAKQVGSVYLGPGDARPSIKGADMLAARRGTSRPRGRGNDRR